MVGRMDGWTNLIKRWVGGLTYEVSKEVKKFLLQNNLFGPLPFRLSNVLDARPISFKCKRVSDKKKVLLHLLYQSSIAGHSDVFHRPTILKILLVYFVLVRDYIQ